MLLAVLPRALAQLLFDQVILRATVLFGVRVRLAEAPGAAGTLRAMLASGASFVVASNHTTAFDVFPFLMRFKCSVLLDKVLV